MTGKKRRNRARRPADVSLLALTSSTSWSQQTARPRRAVVVLQSALPDLALMNTNARKPVHAWTAWRKWPTGSHTAPVCPLPVSLLSAGRVLRRRGTYLSSAVVEDDDAEVQVLKEMRRGVGGG